MEEVEKAQEVDRVSGIKKLIWRAAIAGGVVVIMSVGWLSMVGMALTALVFTSDDVQTLNVVSRGAIASAVFLLIGLLGSKILHESFGELEKAVKNVAGAALVALLAGLVLIDPALAQNSSGWEKPATDLIEVFDSGVVKIATALVGIGIVVLGLWGALTGRIDWMRFGMILICGLLITAGPGMITAIMNTAG